MTNPKILIVDDERLAREGMRLLLGRQPGAHDILEAPNGRQAVAMIRAERPDLVLLDVRIPGMNGFDVVDAVGAAAMPAVIFVTAHDRYAIRAFEVSAIDYLLKPVTQERFDVAFVKAMQRLRTAPAEESAQRVLAMLQAIARPPRHLERFAVRSGERTIFVPADAVDRIEAMQNYVRLHVGESIHVIHVTMNVLQSSLDPARFLRIHRSHIVNIARIAQLWSLSRGQYLIELSNGERLQTGRTYGDTIRSTLTNPF
ncbi:MAG TPA: LytTR family DNA-binding domain-containing protein [Povalibacter sp.]|nr:LytTR family DNA-binding domain-containing protein [Povalibacter sp.]